MTENKSLVLLRLYREALKRCRQLGGERGRGARVDAQAWWRSIRESDLDAAISAAESRVSYLRMITPRYPTQQSSTQSTRSGSFIWKEGTMQHRPPSPTRSVVMKNQHSFDPELLARHERLVERQHFGGRPGDAPRSPFRR